MENNEKKAERRKIKINKKAVLVFVTGVIVGLAILFFVIVNFKPYKVSEPITIPPATLSEHDFAIVKNELLLLNNKGVQAYDRFGEYRWDYAIKTASPLIVSDGSRFSVADTENAFVAGFSKKKQHYAIEFPTPVSGIVTNKNGFTGIISSEHGYRSIISVYDDFGNEHYKWYSGEGYVTAAAISDNDRNLAVATIFASSDNIACTTLHFFDMKKAEPTAEVMLSGEVAYKMIYEGQKIFVLTDKGVYAFNKKGKLKSSYPFYGKTLHAFAFSDSDEIAIALSRTDDTGSMLSGSEIFFLTKGLKVKGSAPTSFEVSVMDFKDGLAAVTGVRNLWLVSSNGKIKAKSSLLSDCEQLLMFDNQKGFATLSGSSACIYSIS